MSSNTHQSAVEGSFKAMLALVRTRPGYRLILLSNMISQLGDWLSYIAISLLTLSSGEGGLALASAYLVHTIPSAFMAPLTGRVADRFDRRLVMIWVALLASLLTVGMCVMAYQQQIWWLQGLTFVRTCLSAFGVTARQAAVPSLVHRKELYTANAVSSIIWSTLFALGVALGGALTASVGATSAIAIDALTFLLSLVVIWQLPALMPNASYIVDEALKSEHSNQNEQKERTAQKNQIKESVSSSELDAKLGLWACWRIAQGSPKLAVSLLAKCPLGLINSAGWMVLSLYATSVFNDNSGAILGLFHASRAIGTGVGPLVFQKIWPNSTIKSSLWAGLTVLILLWSEFLWLSLVSLFFFGALLGYTWVRSSAHIQAYAPSEILGRLTAFDYSASIICQSISILFIGAVYDFGWGLDTGVYSMVSVTLILGSWLINLEAKAQTKL